MEPARVRQRPALAFLACMRAHRSSFAVCLLVATLAACTGGGGGNATSTPRAGARATIPQPPLSKLNERTRRRLARESRRIDLAAPTFSHPTRITNPLFPISHLDSAVLVGKLEGEPWRAETTLLPHTEVVDWNGQKVRTLLSQFIAFLDGRIFEVALDRYAQADDGSVWYFGEDAYSYESGQVADTEGTWLAGVTGPPAMIMPGHPHVGDVYRTENIPPLVFEQVTVKRLGVTVLGPTGPVHGAMVGQELHLDERRLEAKYFAPDYGEFFSGGGHTFEANALAVPVDALDEPLPQELTTLTNDAEQLFDAARSSDWTTASKTVAAIQTSWNAFRGGSMPRRLAAQMGDALRATAGAVASRDSHRSAQGALHVINAALDIELRYRPTAQVDLARFGLWTRQLLLDAGAGNEAAVSGDVATLQWVRDRLILGRDATVIVDDQLRFLGAATEARQLGAVRTAAARLRDTIADIARES